MSNLKRFALAAALTVPLSALAFAQDQTTTTRTETTVIKTAPPAPMSETMPADRPYTEAVWIPGHYAWTGDTYVWRQGHWDRPPVSMRVWVAGHWDQSPDGGWVWTDGHWSAQ